MLAKGLREQAYAVDVSCDGREALYQASITDYDAVVLDVMLPGLDGLRVCEELRRQGSRVPVLMLTARDAIDARSPVSTAARTTTSSSRSTSANCWLACGRSSAGASCL